VPYGCLRISEKSDEAKPDKTEEKLFKSTQKRTQFEIELAKYP